MTSREAFIALNMIEGVGPVRVRQLVQFFGTAPAILSARESDLQKTPGIGADTARAKARSRTSGYSLPAINIRLIQTFTIYNLFVVYGT